MTEFAYNNAKNTCTNYTPLELSCGYYPCSFFEKNTNPWLQSKPAEKLFKKLRKIIIICYKNFYHTQELWKQAHNRGVKPKKQVFSDKVWLNNKYIKIKQNWKMEVKFFTFF